MVDFNMAGSPSDISFFALNAFSRLKSSIGAPQARKFIPTTRLLEVSNSARLSGEHHPVGWQGFDNVFESGLESISPNHDARFDAIRDVERGTVLPGRNN